MTHLKHYQFKEVLGFPTISIGVEFLADRGFY